MKGGKQHRLLLTLAQALPKVLYDYRSASDFGKWQHCNLSFFANRTTSFLPVEGVTADGSPLEPETGTQYELGARSVLLNGRLELNAGLVHLKRADVAVSDRDDLSALIAIGEQ